MPPLAASQAATQKFLFLSQRRTLEDLSGCSTPGGGEAVNASYGSLMPAWSG